MPKFASPNDDLAEELSEFFADGRHACPHCGIVAKPHAMYAGDAWAPTRMTAVISGRENYSSGPHPRFKLSVVICSGCDRESLYIRKWHFEPATGLGDAEQVDEWHKRVFPLGRVARPLPSTPREHFKSYAEACEILSVSPAASACMSRRCLQGLLSGQGYRQKNLVDQIRAVLDEADSRKALSASAHDAVDAIRQFGNFGAHPVTEISSLQIIEVEPGEAEWCIEIAEELFDHYFERPAKLKARIAEANAKLASGGKPALKS